MRMNLPVVPRMAGRPKVPVYENEPVVVGELDLDGVGVAGRPAPHQQRSEETAGKDGLVVGIEKGEALRGAVAGGSAEGRQRGLVGDGGAEAFAADAADAATRGELGDGGGDLALLGLGGPVLLRGDLDEDLALHGLAVEAGGDGDETAGGAGGGEDGAAGRGGGDGADVAFVEAPADVDGEAGEGGGVLHRGHALARGDGDGLERRGLDVEDRGRAAVVAPGAGRADEGEAAPAVAAGACATVGGAAGARAAGAAVRGAAGGHLGAPAASREHGGREQGEAQDATRRRSSCHHDGTIRRASSPPQAPRAHAGAAPRGRALAEERQRRVGTFCAQKPLTQRLVVSQQSAAVVHLSERPEHMLSGGVLEQTRPPSPGSQ